MRFHPDSPFPNINTWWACRARRHRSCQPPPTHAAPAVPMHRAAAASPVPSPGWSPPERPSLWPQLPAGSVAAAGAEVAHSASLRISGADQQRLQRCQLGTARGQGVPWPHLALALLRRQCPWASRHRRGLRQRHRHEGSAPLQAPPQPECGHRKRECCHKRPPNNYCHLQTSCRCIRCGLCSGCTA